MKLGILYPQSKAHASIGFDFLDGIILNLQSQISEGKIAVTQDSIGFGGDDKELLVKAQKMLLEERVDVLVAFLDLKLIQILEPIIKGSGKLLLVVNPGANVPFNWMPTFNIVYLNLQQAFHCWHAGRAAAIGENKNAAVASSFFDCGYLHMATIVNGFVNSGGNLTYNYINNQLYNASFHINEFKQFIHENVNSKKVLCVFDSLPASLLYERINEEMPDANLELFVSPMMLEMDAFISRKQSGYPFTITGYKPWLASVSTEENIFFTETILHKTSKEANLFSLLGWETGLVINQLLQSEKMNGEMMVEKLKESEIKSPRGALFFDAETNHFIAPFFSCKIEKGSTEMKSDFVENGHELWGQFVKENLIKGVVSGWTNTYLCY